MLKKIIAAAFLAALCHAEGFAQEERDTLSLKRAKRVNHYVGVQVNELIRQIFNFSENDNELLDNPYLLNYSLTFGKRGWNINSGLGYRYGKFIEEAPNDLRTETNELFYRIGSGRFSMLGKRVQIGYGLDFAGGFDGRNTTSSQVTDFGSIIDSSHTQTSNNVVTIGGGLRLSLSVYITPMLLIGTETNYYYQHSTNKQHITVTQTIIDRFNGTTTSSIVNSNDELKTAEFGITVPVAIYLIVKI